MDGEQQEQNLDTCWEAISIVQVVLVQVGFELLDWRWKEVGRFWTNLGEESRGSAWIGYGREGYLLDRIKGNSKNLAIGIMVMPFEMGGDCGESRGVNC